MTCPICHSSKNIKIFSATNFHGRYQYSPKKIPIHRCLKCGCIYPNIKINSSFYKKYYPQKYNQKPSILEKIWISINLLFKKTRLPLNSRLLDVGCGRGEFLKSLPVNIKATGIDVNTPKIKNTTIINDDFLRHKFNEKFDVITFWHSLEHFSCPQKTISKAINLLKPGGKIIITIPNTNSLAYHLGQKDWFHLDPPRHLFLPNNQNIKLLFPESSKLKINYLPFEFPLDLFWSFKNHPFLRIFYPIFKMFDQETMLITILP